MKRYIVLLVIIIAGCSTNSTAPPPEANHPFPNSFSTVVVTINALPNHWYSEQHTWDNGNGNSTHDTGSGNYSGPLTFSFNPNSFQWNGDTLRGAGGEISYEYWSVYAIVDSEHGILDSLSLYYSFIGGGSGLTGYTDKSDQMIFHRIAYRNDSINQAQVSLSGDTLLAGLGEWTDEYSSETAEHAPTGSGETLNRNWNGSITGASAITIQFNH